MGVMPPTTPKVWRIFVADSRPAEVDRVHQMITNDSSGTLRMVGQSLYPQTVLQTLTGPQALDVDCVIIQDTMGTPDYAGLQVVRQLLQERPHMLIFVTTDHRDSQAYAQYMAYGARDVLVQPWTLAEFKGILANIQIREQQRVQLAGPATPGGVVATPNGAPPVIRQTMVTVYSPRGGVGKSSLAIALALALQQNPTTPLKVALVDMDVNWGSVGPMLNLKPTVTIKDLIAYMDLLTPESIHQFLATHETGLRVLLAPIHPADEAAVTEEVALRVFDILRQQYDVVIVDTGQVPRDSTIVALEQANHILAVTRLDLPGIKHLREFQTLVRELNSIGEEKIRLVLNQVGRGSEDGVTVQEVQDLLPFPLVAKIPHIPNFQAFVNSGTPLILSPGVDPYKMAIYQIAHSIVPVYGPVLNGKQRKLRNRPVKPAPVVESQGALAPTPPMPMPARSPGILSRWFRRR